MEVKRIVMEQYKIEQKNSHSKQNFEKEEAYLRAKKKLEKLKGFYWHLVSYMAVNTFLMIVIASNLDKGESFWNYGTFSVAFFWGIGLAFHALGVFGPDLMFGKQWEQRKIQEYMDKDKQRWE